jgi:hypothetical protein
MGANTPEPENEECRKLEMGNQKPKVMITDIPLRV